jgi:hypothetical protein
MKAVLHTKQVEAGLGVVINGEDKVVYACTKVRFIYHNRSNRTTLKVGAFTSNSALLIDSLLSYVGYDNLKAMYRNLSTHVVFEDYLGHLDLFLLEFTEERFKFTSVSI